MCSHHWVLIDTIDHGQYTQYKTATCSASSNPHSHYRHAYGTDYVYECAACTERKTEYRETYSSWTCTLNDPGRNNEVQ